MPDQDRTLSDLKVLEYGQMVSAPYCARMMAALGADVLKVEPPTGDRARVAGPFPGGVPHSEKSGLFLCMNLDKKGITLDPATPCGQRVFRRLIEETDILVENNAPGHLDSLGLGYEALRAINPGLIVVSITPLGQSGPYSNYKVHDLNVWHAGGWGYLWRERNSEGEPGRPVRAPSYMASFQAAYNAITAVLGALYFRDCGGSGQHIDVSEQEAMVFVLANAFPVYNEENRIAGKNIAIPASVPSGVLPCEDGYVLLSVIEPHQWKGLAELLGNPEWSQEDWTGSMEGRRLNFDIVNAFLSEWLEGKPVDWVVEKAIEQRIPSSPAGLSIKEVVGDKHLKERGFFAEVEHPVAGTLRYPSVPWRFSGTGASILRPAPLLGQHNDEVYMGHLGYTVGEMARLRSSGVI